jgi:nitrogenase iron protein NifH
MAEVRKRTVIEYAPDSPQAGVYRALAQAVMSNTDLVIPTPLSMDDLEALALRFAA